MAALASNLFIAVAAIGLAGTAALLQAARKGQR